MRIDRKIHICAAVIFLVFSFVPSSSKTQTRVRKNIKYSSDAEIKSLKHGIAIMKERSKNNPADPTGWVFQAELHERACRHDSRYFLAWHRMFLYYFERTLRNAANDSDLTLPYWDYSALDSRALPDVFRIPKGDQNPLYEENRGDHVNDGAGLLDEAVALDAMDQIPFDDTNPAVGDFGFSTSLEYRPHNQVHSAVGGIMANTGKAPLDPIFYLHHSNIDRLWGAWLALGHGRFNPTDSEWLDQSFTFYDADKKKVCLRGEQILNTANQLGYRYDTEEMGHRKKQKVATSTLQSAPASVALFETAERGPFKLNSRKTTILLSILGSDNEKFSKAQGQQSDHERPHAALVFEDLDADSAIEGYFEVYLNLRDDLEPSPKRPEFLGLLSFFGVSPRKHHAKPITRTLMTDSSKLALGENAQSPAKFQLTFFRRGMEFPNNGEAPRFKGTPIIGSIKIALQASPR